jgi:hypothetical protein
VVSFTLRLFYFRGAHCLGVSGCITSEKRDQLPIVQEVRFVVEWLLLPFHSQEVPVSILDMVSAVSLKGFRGFLSGWG